MNITHVCSYYYGSKVYQNLFRNFKYKKCELEVFVPYRNKHFGDISENGFKRFVSIKCLNICTRVSYTFKLFMICLFYLKNKIGKNSELIHAHTLYSDGIPSFLCNIFNKKTLIITVRNTDVNLGFRFFLHFKWLARLALRRAGAVIFISPSHKILFNKYFGYGYDEKLHIIPNGIDKVFHEQAKQNGRRKNKNRGIYVGQIDKNKNIKNAILAYGRVKHGEDWSFTVVGGNYSQFVRCFGVLPDYFKDRTNFVGRVGVEKILEHLDAASLFIMPSYRETFGLVYIEAISQCTPVVYTEDQGIDGYFEEGLVGFSCNPNSLESIKAAISKADERFPEALCFKSKNPAHDFDWVSISVRYKELYSRLVN